MEIFPVLIVVGLAVAGFVYLIKKDREEGDD